MKREKVKKPRGTARKLRRADMSIFKAEREKRREQEKIVTINVGVFRSRGKTAERNPHQHSVATVTDMGGYWLVRQYDWTMDYSANVPAPFRKLLSSKGFQTYGAAKDYADEINRIFVPEHKPLRRAA